MVTVAHAERRERMSTDKERNYLSSLYPGYSWHEKVAGWSNERVIAVYRRFQRDGFPRKEPKLDPDLKLEEEPKPETPSENQTRLFNPNDPPRPPHENEDNFEIY
jgi:hypothetical protein